MSDALRRLQSAVAALLLAAGSLCGVSAQADAAAEAEVWNYRVSAGDTLIAICTQYLARPEDWPRLQKLNGVADARRLQPDSVLRIPLAWMRQTATVADVVFVKGVASLLRTDAAGATSRRLLASGDTVQAGDTIRTAVEASVSLRLADRSRLLITAGTEMRIVHLLQLGRDAIPKVQLQLETGGTEIEVAPAAPGRSFEIRTPAVNLGVRGTEFRARVDGGAKLARVEVSEGRVGAQAEQQQLAIPAGFGTVAEAGKPIAPPRQLIAAPELGAVPKRLERVPLQFAWPAVGGAKAYRAQVLAAGEPLRLLLDGEFDAPAARWQDLPDGSYRLRVRAIDARGNEGHDGVADFVLKARPEPPFTSVPAEGAKVYGDSTRFEWASVAGARRYRLQVSSRADFASLLVDEAGIGSSRHQLALPPGDYHWRVASIGTDADGREDPGPFGDASSFTQRAIPPTPDVQPPAAVDDGVLLRWRLPAPGHRMQFQVAGDRDFSRIVLDRSTEQASALLPKPEPGVYYLRARTIDADGFEGPFGAVQQIEVPQPPPPPPKWLLLLPLGLLLLL
ncbi:FecR domain-containing protein [Piscinibacter sakaiensis]|uniref:FecR family protein n=1 Tax=Piscinibacter sakaiensis TaxID=1547922 RepID=UPI003AAEF595